MKISTIGKTVWIERIHQGGLPSENHRKNTEASPMLAYDGESMYAASPLIHGSNVIVIGDIDRESFLAAMDRETGKIDWKVRRPNVTSFSSPIVASIGGKDQLLISGANMVASYNPANGEMNWKSDGATTMTTCGTILWDDQGVYAGGGYQAKGQYQVGSEAFASPIVVGDTMYLRVATNNAGRSQESVLAIR